MQVIICLRTPFRAARWWREGDEKGHSTHTTEHSRPFFLCTRQPMLRQHLYEHINPHFLSGEVFLSLLRLAFETSTLVMNI
jgi:hypothetical protein